MNLTELLSELFVGQGRLTSAEIQRRAVAADAPADVTTALDALPEGEYAEDEVTEALGQIHELHPDIEPPP